MLKIAINGFGRIGRLVLRALAENPRPGMQVVAINDLGSVETNAHLFTYDSVHGIFKGSVSHTRTHINVGMGPIQILAEPDPKKLPWKDLDIDVVFECSGRFTTHASASFHLEAGAKRVLVSAPCEKADATIVYGINHGTLTAQHKVVSNASCTTNCLAPVAFVLHEAFGIERGYMTTIHAYTGDQSLVDSYHKDLRRARSAPLSMIPASTGAAKAVGLVLPELQGKLDGTAIRVPCSNVSLVDFTFTSKKPMTIAQIHEAIQLSANGPLQSLLDTNDVPLVSCDFNHNPASSIFDLSQTQVIDGIFGRVLSWYDNEWGFSNRMLDTAEVMGRLLG